VGELCLAKQLTSAATSDRECPLLAQSGHQMALAISEPEDDILGDGRDSEAQGFFASSYAGNLAATLEAKLGGESNIPRGS
jgi:hypothetical protein